MKYYALTQFTHLSVVLFDSYFWFAGYENKTVQTNKSVLSKVSLSQKFNSEQQGSAVNLGQFWNIVVY